MAHKPQATSSPVNLYHLLVSAKVHPISQGIEAKRVFVRDTVVASFLRALTAIARREIAVRSLNSSHFLVRGRLASIPQAFSGVEPTYYYRSLNKV
jgi:hypothetical protein